MRRKSLRIAKAYDTFEFKAGNAGFIQLIKNGKRSMPKNRTLTFNRPKPALNQDRSKDEVQ